MTNLTKRIGYLFYLLSKSNEYLRSCDLAEKTGVTERTIKGDIAELSEYAKHAGAELLSKKGKGYKLQVLDKEKMQRAIKQHHIYFETSGFEQSGKLERCGIILKKLLVEQHYMTLDDLADKIFMSKSSIREDIKLVNEYLEKFQLRWKRKNEHGPLIVGNEFDRRMLMICLLGSHYHETVTFHEENDFYQWFSYDWQTRQDIRHIFLKVLRASGCHVRDERSETLSQYLILMTNRFKYGYIVDFDSSQKKYIRQLKQYQVSLRIFYELSDYPDYQDLHENEILAFALLIAEYSDISENEDLHKYYPSQLKEAKKLITEYDLFMKREYGICLSDYPDYHKLLTEVLIPVLIQKDFKCCHRDVRILHFQDARVKNSPLAVQMAFDVAELFEKKYRVSLSFENILSISSSLHTILLSVEYDYRPIRALIYAYNGLQYAKTFSEIIHRRFPGCFECVKPYELYEMRGLETEAYDCCLLVLPREDYLGELSYKYDWPWMQFDTVPTQKQMNELYNRFVLNGVQLKKAYSHLNIQKIHTYRNINVKSLDSLIDLISFKSGKDAESIQKIQDSLHVLPICTVNSICVMFIKRKHTEESICDLYQLKSDLKIESETVSYVLVISCEFDGSFQAARLLNDVMYMLFSSSVMLEKLMKNSSPECLIEIARESLKVLTISL